MNERALQLFINKALLDYSKIEFMPLNWFHDSLNILNVYNNLHGFIEFENINHDEAFIINLNFLPHAIESLLGGWQLQIDGTLIWTQGLLIKAIDNGHRNIIVKNIRPLNENIVDLFHKIRCHQLIKLTDGRFYQIPSDLFFAWSEEPCVTNNYETCIEGIYKKIIVKNQRAALLTLERLATMSFTYEFKDGQFDIKEGWIFEYHNKPLNINVPLTLPVEAWVYFLNYCLDNSIKLKIYTANGVKLPDFLKKFVHKKIEHNTELNDNKLHKNNLFIYHSDCPDITLHSLPDNYKQGSLLIEVDENTNIEDFAYVEAIKSDEKYTFITHPGNVAKFFNNQLDGKSLIIKGSLNRQWQDLLSENIISKNFTGTLIIINYKKSAFPFLADLHDIISITRKKQFLNDIGYSDLDNIPLDILKNESVENIIKIYDQYANNVSNISNCGMYANTKKIVDVKFQASNDGIKDTERSKKIL